MSGGELIIADDIVNDPDLVMEVWTRHFRELGHTPEPSRVYDDRHKDFVEDDLLVMEWICEQSSDGLEHPISPGEVACALNSLNSGKAADMLGLKAEHLKKAGRMISTFLANLFNAGLDLGHTLQPLNKAISDACDNRTTLHVISLDVRKTGCYYIKCYQVSDHTINVRRC